MRGQLSVEWDEGNMTKDIDTVSSRGVGRGGEEHHLLAQLLYAGDNESVFAMSPRESGKKSSPWRFTGQSVRIPIHQSSRRIFRAKYTHTRHSGRSAATSVDRRGLSVLGPADGSERDQFRRSHSTLISSFTLPVHRAPWQPKSSPRMGSSLGASSLAVVFERTSGHSLFMSGWTSDVG